MFDIGQHEVDMVEFGTADLAEERTYKSFGYSNKIDGDISAKVFGADLKSGGLVYQMSSAIYANLNEEDPEDIALRRVLGKKFDDSSSTRPILNSYGNPAALEIVENMIKEMSSKADFIDSRARRSDTAAVPSRAPADAPGGTAGSISASAVAGSRAQDGRGSAK